VPLLQLIDADNRTLRNYVRISAPQRTKIMFEMRKNISNMFFLISNVVFVICGRVFEGS
jgi:hypothetical protein